MYFSSIWVHHATRVMSYVNTHYKQILYGNSIESSQKEEKTINFQKNWGSKHGPMSKSTNTTTGGSNRGM
jgi:hypothetical protein